MSQATENNPGTPAPPAPVTAPSQPATPAQPGPVRSGATATGQPSRAEPSPRRTRVVLRQIGPLSVLKFSLFFYFCVWLILFLALVIVYTLASAVGAIDALEKMLGYIAAPSGTDVSTRGATPLEINEGVVFTWIFLGGCVMTIIWSVINVLVSFLYNLISDVAGGIEFTLAEKRPRH